MKLIQSSIAIALLFVLGVSVASVRAADAPTTAPATQPAAFKTIDVEKFAELSKDPQKVILDVRTRKEYDAGHIPGAINFDVLNEDQFKQQVATLDKSKTYLVHCAAGGRGKRACKELSTLDFPDLYNLKGGFNAWKAAGEPVTTDPTPARKP